MKNSDVDFETWFSTLANLVQDGSGVNFQDEDSVKADYEAGKDVHDVADEIIAEYGE